jgi:hypothetical protein
MVMSDERYQLRYSGLAEGADASEVKAQIQARFQMPLPRIEQWFGKNRAVIGGDLAQDRAWKIQHLLESVGVRTILVEQPRSNLSLSNLQMEPAAPKPAVTVNHFQPTGLAEFEARPLSQPTVTTTYRRRRPASRPVQEKSSRLPQMVAAVFLVAVCAFAGKQLMTEDSPISHALASFTQAE